MLKGEATNINTNSYKTVSYFWIEQRKIECHWYKKKLLHLYKCNHTYSTRNCLSCAGCSKQKTLLNT